jgi:hypothetical protein
MYLAVRVTAGTNLTLPLKVFFPSLLTYLKTSSACHMGKLTKSIKGLNTNFPSRSTITQDMWRLAQRLDVHTFLLPHVEWCN